MTEIDVALVHANMAIDAVFNSRFAEDAIYRPPPGAVGGEVNCRVMLGSEDQDLNLGQSRAIARGNILEVRVSEVPNPVEHGRFLLGDETYAVASAPKALDPERLTLTMTVVPVAI